MIATVKDVKFNVEMGKYRVTKLYVINDKGEDKEYTVFTNAKYHPTVAGLKAGENIELKMVKNGAYWNIEDVSKVEGQVSTPTSGGSGGSYKREESGNKDIAIARAVSLKAGVELYGNLIAAGLVKKTLKPDAAVEEVFAIVKKFEGYCTLETDLESLTSDTKALAGAGDGDYTEADFPE
jgi:hypothetical protein